MSKVKVFKLAKDYGFKSAEFVDVLRNIGFPVTSYQASVEEWDVPVIHERLVRGGLITGTAEDTKKSEEKSSGGGAGAGAGAATPSWADLLTGAAAAGLAEEVVEDEPVVEPESAPVEEPVVEEPVA